MVVSISRSNKTYLNDICYSYKPGGALNLPDLSIYKDSEKKINCMKLKAPIKKSN